MEGAFVANGLVLVHLLRNEGLAETAVFMALGLERRARSAWCSI